ncbi:hypothetical protein ACSBR1_003874 [Camellia fascicularis]
MFEVGGIFGDQYVVDLDAKTCSCRRWDLTRIPCAHAVAVIWNCNKEPEAFADHWCRKDTYLRAYNHIIYPMNGQDMWLKTGFPKIKPPKYYIKPGRPKKVRIREPNKQPKQPTKLRKYQTSLKCTKCGNSGHNKRTCKSETKWTRGK